MNYWQGQVNWPVHPDWKCSTCGGYAGLEWGLVHAECRCNRCHTQYMMRKLDETRAVVTEPICMLKPEYVEVCRLGWKQFQRPIDTFTDAEYDALFAALAAARDAEHRLTAGEVL